MHNLRTLGIIGGGIVGKSLLFALAMADRQKYDRVIIFESQDFAPACTLHSTAIVANRGVLPGISPLGDLIHQGISAFREHVKNFSPHGVYPVYQVSSAIERLDMFKRRYQEFTPADSFRDISFKKELPLVVEEAFYVNPRQYCEWLYQFSAKKMEVLLQNDFVKEIDEENLTIHTQKGEQFKVDHLIFAGNIKNKLWSKLINDPRTLKSKPVVGSFLVFSDVDWGPESYSFSIDERNLIYRSESRELLIGATSEQGEIYHLNEGEKLQPIYQYFSKILTKELPDFNLGRIVTGVREKSSKREPYYGTNGHFSYLGGLYKNGFTLSLKMATTLVNQLP